MSLVNNLANISILTEAPNDDLFDIDKEVDAQIKRVQNRVIKKEAQANEPPQETNQTQEELPTDDSTENPEDTNVEDQNDDTVDDNTPSEEEDNLNPDDSQSDDYDYMDGSDTDGGDIPDDYEPKQTIPELRILSTLSDKEYKICNIRILEQFQELKRNVTNTINNLLPSVVTKNKQQSQVVSIVNKNLYDMIQDIDYYVSYRNNNIYEENVKCYLTYLRRYQIATNLIKLIIDQNIKEENDNKNLN